MHPLVRVVFASRLANIGESEEGNNTQALFLFFPCCIPVGIWSPLSKAVCEHVNALFSPFYVVLSAEVRAVRVYGVVRRYQYCGVAGFENVAF